MYPPIFQACAADSGVTALLGTSPVRLYPFGEAEERPLLDEPYATWQIVGGEPQNTLACPPDMDSFSVQVDVWAKTASASRDVAMALRDVIELHAYIVSWRGESRDVQTRNYRYSFDVDWFVQRNP